MSPSSPTHSAAQPNQSHMDPSSSPGAGSQTPERSASSSSTRSPKRKSENALDNMASPTPFQFTFGSSTDPKPSPASGAGGPLGKITGRANPPGTGGQSPSRGDGGAGGAGSANNKRAKRSSPNRASQASNGQANNGSAAAATAAATAAAAAAAASEAKPGNSDSPGDNTSAAPANTPSVPTSARQENPGSHSNVPYQVPPRPLTPFRNPDYPEIDLQPRTRAISLSQLVNEVKGIYVGLAMVENKCIEIDNEQSANKDPNNKLDDDQWQALMALHRTLLHEHHDFMLASQHPSASPALRRVAQKYAMPARMWRHGIHSFLELLRHRLPESREHMITFIYTAYSIIALLYESVDAFSDTWVECLGDLSRYRMAIEDDNLRGRGDRLTMEHDNHDVRDTWTVVSRRWYSLASDHSPTVGRLYHHLAILARPSLVTQMFYYVKSLCVPTPFASTHESIKTLLEPLLASNSRRSVEYSFTKVHAILFALTGTTKSQRAAQYQGPVHKTDQAKEAEADLQSDGGDQLKHADYARQFPNVVHRTLVGLDDYLSTVQNWVQRGTHMAILNSCALLSYGRADDMLLRLLSNDSTKEPITNSNVAASDSIDDRVRPHHFVSEMDKSVFKRALAAKASHGYIHARLVWMFTLARLPSEGMEQVERFFPWQELVDALNEMLLTCTRFDRIEKEQLMTTVDHAKERQARLLADIAVRKEEEQRKQRAIYEQQHMRIRLEKQQPPAQKMTLENLVLEAGKGLDIEVDAAAVTDADEPELPPVMSAVPPDMPMPTPLLVATPLTLTRMADDETKPIPDDWALRGLVWTENYYPKDWFKTTDDAVDDDEKLLETASVAVARQERILWLGCRLAAFKKWILYDGDAHRFSVTPEFARVTSPVVNNETPDLDMEDAS